MPTPNFRLSDSQVGDLAVACEIGGPRLEEIAANIARQKPTIRRSKIEAVLQGDLGPEKGAAMARLLFGIAGTFRRASLSAKEVLDAITPAIKAREHQDERLRAWDGCRAGLERLLNTQSISLAAKAIDISYDFERVYIAGRLLTSVRPVFDEHREEIVGSTIVQTLRLEFVSSDGDQSSISIALDADDIKQLRKECERAINKAETAKGEIEAKFRLEAIITGEE
jgi:hypothetical protein